MNFKVINQKLNDLLTSLGLTRKQGFYAALSVGVIILALISYVALFTAPQNNTGLEIFSVEADLSSKGNVAQSLEYKGFVKSSLGFQIAFALRGNKEIRSGAYQISKSMNVWEIAKILNGEPTLKWVTIPEGLRKEEIADILAMTLKWSDEDKLKWITTYTAMEYDYMEGVYFPDTYLIPINETPLQVANRLRAHFEEKFAPFAQEALKQNIKWDTALKLASIVQREAAGKDDMSLIAGVLWNRLLKGMKLEVDATVQYARGKTAQGWWTPIKPADKQIQSAYNTYLNKGLPPHPISNPGIDAINATLNSTETKCLYYLHEESGIIHCAETYEEHLSNIEKYLK
ncbi:MAG: Aminodeoxychorismate lyase [Candidatus Yanofskybacteria bacterium GW2011_GWF1_44_227]|uniref:Endolytic murein transglycosylase n=1 Tax=Candidatus Yanofskybacteria bacterium GW2011_GWE2_40_11 TaxID=1619033 RepID=A0A0G0QT64_9BACT|nr:MAG: Aminodeoxychorismate lyase [Candidatus Yanofskybacteria bacterium GW2011_GWE2_40_11]KKT15648.1 MAG: Aminodeoxychorismate lyase [Candidatus Yanofskybacteria bacterium GW2011_GWF2_43_596]KKT53303.1 MAG: Aminodeoxychorismate lyase [Candidatus Yanofskybacteria bacterium GW2011_GWF1_44_227]OGN35935.1 MAG: hypothetical protein A2207_02645 [Candidatus Yanofskybacteria bacterium RIFOXYA1_FULL_44_17]OGN36463.1 MAG: hypothetical protein A2241_01840 [Candidatus Yanofskybacteria bacterium RIFOXYA2_